MIEVIHLNRSLLFKSYFIAHVFFVAWLVHSRLHKKTQKQKLAYQPYRVLTAEVFINSLDLQETQGLSAYSGYLASVLVQPHFKR